MVNLVLQVQHGREGQEVGCVCPGKIILIKYVLLKRKFLL